MFLGHFPYTIVQISRDENCWGRLLLHLVTRPVVPVCVHASVKYAEVIFARSGKYPTMEDVRSVQASGAGDGSTVDTASGVASLDSEGLCGVEYHGPPCDPGPGRDRVSEEATAGVSPLGGGRTPWGRCNDGSA